ncbi:hypothetical protein [Streptomyces paradoxus]|uniref:NMD protein affecting ribosome stability and mRNA decay n=1 Tax=Streptomyces paradoxus TaxID=66375 RepID=A0A7W9T9X6_9ACTN|nr:hypothetical protein [Streptomyces paradoxus]MBB6076779.1 NMD protein affecting ribosome stability and mRNA decay [Streptomyces paradoxus]
MESPPGGGDEGPDAEPRRFVCARCGTSADVLTEGPPLTWTYSVENGVRHHYCESCSRENLRSIEGRLDSDWW